MVTPPHQAQSNATTRLIMLGTGTPNCEADRAGSALAIIINDQPYLVDCGPGVIRRAAAAHLPLTKLDRLFITHLHSDHTIGYPDVILSPAVLGRNTPLEAFGPPGLQSMTDHLLAAFQEDISERLDGLEKGDPTAYQVNAHEITAGEIYHDENVHVTAFQVQHGSWQHAFGYKFQTPDKTIVISGDTVPSDILIEHARGCDILIHEVYSQAGFEGRPPHWQEYHRHAHTSTTQLAEIAEKIQPRLLVLTHALLWGTSKTELLAEIAREYDGQVVFASDLDCFA